VKESILLPGVRVGDGAVLRRVVVDDNVVIPPRTVIGANGSAPRFTMTAQGITVLPEGTLIG
jgi:glucose-1-phosphate adenylyltransferase